MTKNWIKIALAGVMLVGLFALLSSCSHRTELGRPMPHDALTAQTDPGVALYEQLHVEGATMPASWAQTADDNHQRICASYATGYGATNWTTVDPYWDETKPMIIEALQRTGFCS